jgi:uncharacterized protein YukE
MNEKELLQLKKDIDEAKQKTSELKGERQALLKRLKEEWNCSTVEEAEVHLKEMEEQVSNLSTEISEEIESIEHELE